MLQSDISIGSSLGYSVLGICIVFLMLIFLWIVIVILAAVLKRSRSSKEPEPVPAAAAPVPAAPVACAPGSAGDVKLYNVSDRDAAMIMAIVADTTGYPLNELRFISIREVSDHEV